MIDQQAVVKLGASRGVVNSRPPELGSFPSPREACPQLLHGRTSNHPSFLSRQPLTVTFTLDQYSHQ